MASVRFEWEWMSKKFRLPFLCALLAIAVAAGCFLAPPPKKDALAAFNALDNEASEAAAEKADRMAAEILERPLFTPGRQPPEVKIVQAEPPKLQGRLAGVMLRSDGREALFTRPGGRPLAVKEGEVIDGWTLSRIETGRVVLTSAFGEQVVTPTHGSAEEITPGQRPVKRNTPTKPQPGQNPKPQQQTVAAAAGPAGRK